MCLDDVAREGARVNTLRAIGRGLCRYSIEAALWASRYCCIDVNQLLPESDIIIIKLCCWERCSLVLAGYCIVLQISKVKVSVPARRLREAVGAIFLIVMTGDRSPSRTFVGQGLSPGKPRPRALHCRYETQTRTLTKTQTRKFVKRGSFKHLAFQL